MAKRSKSVQPKSPSRPARSTTARRSREDVPGGAVSAGAVSNRRGYPRPQLVRDFAAPGTSACWGFLNGQWDFAVDPDGHLAHPDAVDFSGQKITVPFAPETPASGIGETGFFKAAWYRRLFDPPALAQGQRLLLHFGAVDYHATVYLDGTPVRTHEGGYSPFTVDLTEHLRRRPGKGGVEIVVHAYDDPHDLAKPRGKQDWLEHPHAIWYARTTGIWQSVWWEFVPESHVASVRWNADALHFRVTLDAQVAMGREREDFPEGDDEGELQVRVTLSLKGKTLAESTAPVTRDRTRVTLHLPDPGIGDARHPYLWAPWHPNLLDARIDLLRGDRVVDTVSSYTAMRHVALRQGRFWLNGYPVRLDLVLDQGYWQQSGMTAPDDDALRRDVELTKALGFNGVRKHQKIEDPRYLYWADRLGLFVWSEFPACYAFTPEAVARTTRQWVEAVERDVSHPCIIAWVPFNESWGVPDLSDSAPQRALVDGIYHLTHAIDPTRPVIGNDGWELGLTDVLAVHDYDADPQAITRRYQQREHFLHHERPGHKMIVLPGYERHHEGLPVLLTEFGGIAFSKDHQGTWGYSRARSSDDLAGRYARLLHAVRHTPILGGFCYTQLTDTYQEANGLLYMDRTPKFDPRLAAIATRGPRNDEERQGLEETMRR